MQLQKKTQKIGSNFSKIRISLASPENILRRSYGEVVKPETINYRSYKPEMGGLFCERIFGPIKDYECHCGKYKRIRYKGIVCDRCGVEVTEKKVRRERMGHINLVVPVAHIWYFRSLPNKIGYLLGIPTKKLDMVIYYERYVVIQSGIAESANQLDLLTEEEYLDILDSLPRENQMLEDSDPNKFIAKMGAEGLEMLLQRIDLDKLSYDLRIAAATETSQQRKQEALKRLKVIEGFRSAQKSGENRPEWMIMKMLPVIPPELRPLVPLEGGRFATSDLNDLYRRVIIRNNRLKRLVEIKAPEVILRNEKRMLQEAVDSLLDNTRRASAVKSEGNRPLKSLSDMLKGKQGRFRQNLLGKRVDYSGRSVIVVGPTLKLNECGLPKNMAAELFKPFIIRKLIERGIVKTVKTAKKIVEKKDPVIWDILENILKGHPVLLNRAPTLHRLGIQAFQPKLVEGKAIQLHPLVCSGFNADFDGDQMAVHVPLGNAAVAEAQLLMLASHNILNPANGAPVTVPSQDMILGLYYISKERKGTKEHPVKGEGLTFYGAEEVQVALNEGRVELHAPIKCKVTVLEAGELKEKVIDTTVGRVIFNQVVPTEVGYVNEVLKKKNLRDIITQVIRVAGVARAAQFLDDIKDIGFQYAFKGGLSFNLSNVEIPVEKDEMIAKAMEEVREIQSNADMGFITNNERYNQVIDLWTRVNNQLARVLFDRLQKDDQGFNPIYMMLDSGARGSKEQIRQLGGMRGLMAKPQKNIGGGSGDTIENPIISNFKEGLNVLEYFVSTHGARKGLADTALKTADAGYLTRRLHDVAQDVVIVEEDCGTLRGITMQPILNNDEVTESLYERILGRTSVDDVIHPDNGEVLAKAGEELTEEIAQAIEDAGVEEVEIRSVLTCETQGGVCSKCYGRNLASGRMVQAGEAVGVIAAQSIGEPGTQLTLRTFHTGGTALNIAAENTLETKYDGVVAFDGIRTVTKEVTNDEGETVKTDIVLGRSGEVRILDLKAKTIITTYNVPYGAHLMVKEGDKAKKGDILCTWDPFNTLIISDIDGKVEFENIIEGVNMREEGDDQTGLYEYVITESKDKTKVPMIKVIGKDGKEELIKIFNMPMKSILVAKNSAKVKAGDILAKIPRSASRTRDITGGLPRVTELFEARNPSNPAVVAEIDGVVSYGISKRGNQEIIVTSKDGDVKHYQVPLSKHILVHDGDYVRAGQPLSDGAITPQDILRIEGPASVQRYVLNGIQEVYRLQGVKINDKHIEVIVRQMMQKMEINDPGDTRFLENESVDKWMLIKENDWIWDKKFVTNAGESCVMHAGQIVSLKDLRQENSALRRQDKALVEYRDAVPATASPILQGITKASLGTRSFMSAASFQETTKVLNEAAISGKIDDLRGLKENVIVGHLIPAGTGMRRFQNVVTGSREEYDRLMAVRYADEEA
ncbi:MAG: DNA-directed RNA polymerase subunit beta' [Bacteroidetes bacterium]|nr:DNA-directed RNA polymerase subunit beta' [Bacteroidota bacterium]MDA0942788.1 DNA-directed RNA polymerase subunit beta' [Bacteroidota bacterium]MDA1111868.1 DNA-directed RNA polymerase subunit beta' [Bacteroidota bacterium]